jgi:RNA polymerase sigma-70 factor (ECF subfamily)
LLGIARRQVLTSLRVTHREVGLIEEAAEMVPDGAPLAWEEGDVPALRKVVLSLPDPFREALVLCDLQELSYDEAAQVMGCPVGTIRSRLNRARQMLAERMERSSRRVAVRPAATEIEGC